MAGRARRGAEALRRSRGYDGPGARRTAGTAAAVHARDRAAAGPTTGAVTLDDLLAHAGDLGLDARAGAIRSLARWSIRLTPAADGRSQLGGEPGLPDGVPWPSADGRQLPCLAQLDLEDVAALGVATPVPADGRLLVFAEPGQSPFPRGRLLVVPGPGARGPEPLAVSPELTLPRVWSAPVQDVGLADEVRDAWEALRA